MALIFVLLIIALLTSSCGPTPAPYFVAPVAQGDIGPTPVPGVYHWMKMDSPDGFGFLESGVGVWGLYRRDSVSKGYDYLKCILIVRGTTDLAFSCLSD